MRLLQAVSSLRVEPYPCGDWHKAGKCIITLCITESITTVTAGLNTIIHTVNAMTNSTIRNTNTKSRKNTTRDIVDTTTMTMMMTTMTINRGLKIQVLKHPKRMCVCQN